MNCQKRNRVGYGVVATLQGTIQNEYGSLTSDPNRAAEEEYIVRLVGRVTPVSLETQKLLATLPPLFATP